MYLQLGSLSRKLPGFGFHCKPVILESVAPFMGSPTPRRLEAKQAHPALLGKGAQNLHVDTDPALNFLPSSVFHLPCKQNPLLSVPGRQISIVYLEKKIKLNHGWTHSFPLLLFHLTCFSCLEFAKAAVASRLRWEEGESLGEKKNQVWTLNRWASHRSG